MKLLAPKILFILLIGYSKSIKAQQIIKHFTIEDGLPSNEVYFVHQDKSGCFWFCTDRGVSRYNGYEFTNYTTADGLSNNTVFKVFEDRSSNLWFTAVDGSVTIFNGASGKFSPFVFNPKLKESYAIQKWVSKIAFDAKTENVYFFMEMTRENDSVHVMKV